ncbi:MAG: hypothetical protein KJ063_24745 [Anaerolineae bacterium]|nr:hypothetical protein [Anaerolineae bacterium]
MQFQRSYASQAINTYTTTLGHGWTHNYEMRLHFEDVTISGTVELQAPGGSRLPFFVGAGNSYTPYPGVTAQLEQQGDEYIVTGFNQMTYIFNSWGELIRQVDPYGNEITFSYHHGALFRAYQGDRELDYHYDSGRLIRVSDNLGRNVEFGYENNELVIVTNTLGLVTTYEYSGTTHLLTKVVDPSGVTVEQTAYDSQGRAYRQWDGVGNLLVDIDYTLSNSRRITENNVIMTHTYNVLGTLVDTRYDCSADIANCQVGTSVNYDGNFKHNGILDANGHYMQIAWDAGGSNLEQITNALNHHSLFDYNSLNNLTEIENARGYGTTYSYENTDLPTFRTSSTDALQQTTFYLPTATGLLAFQEDPDGRVSHYWYNEYGQVTQTVRAHGTTDAITMTYGYDVVGRLITATQVSLDIPPVTSLNVYDAGNRLIATIQNWTGTNPTTWENNCSFTSGPRDSNICTRYGYDPAGRPISTTNPLSQTNLTFYNTAGRVVTTVVNYDNLTSPVTLCTDFTNPDPEYNICSLTGYDAHGRVVTRTNSLGLATVTEYNSLGQVSRTIVNWEDGIFTEIQPDRDLITEYTYDAAGNVLLITDPLGRQTRTFYDELNRVKGSLENWDGIATLADCATLPRERDENICTLYQYDEVGNTIFVTNTLTQTTRTFYDELNRVRATVHNWQPGFDSPSECYLSPDNNDDENICTLYGYDANSRPVTTTNALSQTTLTVYDAVGRPFLTVFNWDGSPINEAADCQFPPAYPHINVCTLITYDSLGRRSTSQDALGQITEFAYDGLGRLITTTRYLDAAPITTHISYDALGNRLTTTNAEGHTTHYQYDTLNRLVQTTTPEGVITTQAYNAASWVITTTNGAEQSTVISYDLSGRRLSITDPENNTTSYEYDALGNQVAVTDAAGVRTGYLYDGLNRLVAVMENHYPDLPPTEPPYHVTTQYRYDALGNHTVITNALGLTTTHTVYDNLNRPTIIRDALGNETHLTYNALNLKTVITDTNEAVTLYSYDALNRLVTIGYMVDGEIVSYAYDALGNRLTMIHNTGITTYGYDDWYRLITVTNPFSGTILYGYDTVGNRTSLTYPDNKAVTYTYDTDNRLIEVEDWLEEVTTYQYDNVGRLITTTLPNGVITINSYDAANRLINLSHHHEATNTLFADYLYQLDGVGNRVIATETLRMPLQIGPYTLTSASDANERQNPTIAYNSQDEEYLVVWQEFDEGESQWFIQGQRMSEEGVLLDEPFIIADRSIEPAVAYNPHENYYLVVWRNNDDQIEASFVSYDGIPDSSFLIADSYFNSHPSVAYNPDDDTFTVIWYTLDNLDDHAIYAYKVEEQAEPVLVASETSALTYPALAVSDDGTHLVVWQDSRDSQWEIYGQRLESDLTLSGGNVALTDSSDDELTPAVAWSDVAEAFLVVWHNNGGFTPQGVQGRRMLANGSTPGSTLSYSHDNNAHSPIISTTPTGWWVAWQQGNPASLYSQHLLTDGSKEGDNVAMLTSSYEQTSLALPRNSVNGTVLLVWADEHESHEVIHHTLLTLESLETTIIQYSYDPLYRLTSAVYSGNLTAEYIYAYDLVGNMVAYTETIGTTTITATRTFNAANQLQTSTDLEGTTDYVYDANGNLTGINLPDIITWLLYDYNQRNLLVEHSTMVLGVGVETLAQFVYDGDGNRLQQLEITDNMTTTITYTNDILGLSQVLVSDDGTTQTTNLFGLDLISQDDSTETRYLLPDGLGSVRVETVGSSVETATTYAPYGSLLARTGSSGTVYGFTGEQHDGATGFIYLRARYYAPDLHILLSRDPWQGDMRRPYTMHGYMYVFNNPIRFTDPRGMDCFETSTGGTWCHTTPTNSTLTINPTFTNPIYDVTGWWEVLVYGRHGDVIFYGEQYIAASCDLFAVSGMYEQVHGIQYSLFGTERSGTYSQTNFQGGLGVNTPLVSANGFIEYSQGSGGQNSANIGVSGSLLNDIVAGQVEYSGDRMSFEGSIGFTTGGMCNTGGGFNVGTSFVDSREVWVVVPSKVSNLYPNKDALAENSFPRVVETESFLPLRYLRTATRFYAPVSAGLHIFDLTKNWPTPYRNRFRFPFPETADGHPPSTLLNYYHNSNSCFP